MGLDHAVRMRTPKAGFPSNARLIANTKLLGVCFLNVALNAICFCSFTLFVADD